MTTTQSSAIPIIFNGSFIEDERVALEKHLLVFAEGILRCSQCGYLSILASVDRISPWRRSFDFEFRCACRTLFAVKNLSLQS